MKKRKFFMNEEKEENWLNEMSKQGWHFTHFSPFTCTYTFEQGEPNEYTYRLDFISEKSPEYIDFIESTGAEKISQHMSWIYFRKRQADGPFVLYSDSSSRLAMLQRMLVVYITVLIVNVCIVYFNYSVNGHLNFIKGISSLNIVAVALMGYLVIFTSRRMQFIKKQQSMFE